MAQTNKPGAELGAERRGRKTIRLTRLALLVTLLATASLVCGGPSTPPSANKALGTCEQGGYLFLRWREGLEVMIWHDLSGEATARSTGFVSGRFYIEHGSARAADRQNLTWEVQTTDGTLGQAQIGGARYDLADGTLFLVTTRGGATEVQQLSRDLQSVPLDHDGILAFARKDPDLAAFLNEIPPATPPAPRHAITAHPVTASASEAVSDRSVADCFAAESTAPHDSMEVIPERVAASAME
jgi:hypothetical protein